MPSVPVPSTNAPAATALRKRMADMLQLSGVEMEGQKRLSLFSPSFAAHGGRLCTDQNSPNQQSQPEEKANLLSARCRTLSPCCPALAVRLACCHRAPFCRTLKGTASIASGVAPGQQARVELLLVNGLQLLISRAHVNCFRVAHTALLHSLLTGQRRDSDSRTLTRASP